MANLLKSLYEGVRKSRQRNRAMGFDYVKCLRCNGTGELSKGYRDYDGSGSFWVSGQSCSCSFGQVKVSITRVEQIVALKELLAELEKEEAGSSG